MHCRTFLYSLSVYSILSTTHITMNKTLHSPMIKRFHTVQPDMEVDWYCRFESDPVEEGNYTNILVICGK